MANIKQEPLDENGREHGEWVDYWYNGQLCYRCNYIHGIRHGLDEQYNKDGRLAFRGYWNMDIRFGYWYFYDEKYYYLCLV